jgi:hypothetical protein
MAIQNWNIENTPKITINDKLKELLKQRSKLVLVQAHELERIKMKGRFYRFEKYIDDLYTHYIVKKLPKTYLN